MFCRGINSVALCTNVQINKYVCDVYLHFSAVIRICNVASLQYWTQTNRIIVLYLCSLSDFIAHTVSWIKFAQCVLTVFSDCRMAGCNVDKCRPAGVAGNNSVLPKKKHESHGSFGRLSYRARLSLHFLRLAISSTVLQLRHCGRWVRIIMVK